GQRQTAAQGHGHKPAAAALHQKVVTHHLMTLLQQQGIQRYTTCFGQCRQRLGLVLRQYRNQNLRLTRLLCDFTITPTGCSMDGRTPLTEPTFQQSVYHTGSTADASPAPNPQSRQQAQNRSDTVSLFMLHGEAVALATGTPQHTENHGVITALCTAGT